MAKYGAVANQDLGTLIESINKENDKIITVMYVPVKTSLTGSIPMFVAVVEHEIVVSITPPARCLYMVKDKQCVKDVHHEGEHE